MSKLLISIFAGIGGMLGWGSADYFVNKIVDKVGNFKVFFWMQMFGAVVIAALAFAVPPVFKVSIVNLLLIFIATISLVAGYLLFYKAFEIGNVAVVSATVTSAPFLTVLISYFVFGQRLTSLQFIGIPAILLGNMIVSLDFASLKKGKFSFLAGFKLAAFAAILFGVFTYPVTDYVIEKMDWVFFSIIEKIFSISLLIIFALIAKKSIDISKHNSKTKFHLLLIGLLDIAALIAVNYGLYIGDSIIVVPISQSLSVITIALSVIFLKEKIKLNQVFGVLVVILGIVLTSI